jgi:Rod binding domain-containing protein
MDLPPLSAPAFPVKPAPAADKNAALAAESAKDFEAMFLGQMVDEMLSTVNIGAFGGGHAEDTWRSFLSNAIGQSIADQNATGIAKGIESAMQRYGTGRDL